MEVLIDPRNGPVYDTVPGTPIRWAVLATSPRTGSTLLARLLDQTGRVGHPKEYVNPTQLRDWEVRLGAPASRLRHALLRGPAVALAGRLPWSEARRRAHLARVAARRAGPTGWMLLKVHHHHAARFFPDDPRPWLPGLRWIRLTREDRLGQALSWARARQTGRWAAHDSAYAPPVYRRAAITRALRRIHDADRGWDALIGSDPCLHLTFEELTGDPLTTVNAVLDWLDEPPVAQVTPPLIPQADAVTQAWRRRYLAGR